MSGRLSHGAPFGPTGCSECPRNRPISYGGGSKVCQRAIRGWFRASGTFGPSRTRLGSRCCGVALALDECLLLAPRQGGPFIGHRLRGSSLLVFGSLGPIAAGDNELVLHRSHQCAADARRDWVADRNLTNRVDDTSSLVVPTTERNDALVDKSIIRDDSGEFLKVATQRHAFVPRIRTMPAADQAPVEGGSPERSCGSLVSRH